MATVVKAEFESIEVILGFGTNFQNFGTKCFCTKPNQFKVKGRENVSIMTSGNCCERWELNFNLSKVIYKVFGTK